MARAVNGRPDVRVEDSRILVIIKKAGGKVCGSFTNASAPAANFTTLNKVWSGNNAVSLLGQECTLPPGDYELTVQLFANGPRGLEPISEEKIKAFTIKGNEQQTYQPPQPMLPANGTILKEEEIKKPVTFRWTPVVPRPQDPVTYRLRVWRMAEGQNSISATIIQQPILGNDVGNVTQAIVRLNTTSPNSNSPEIYVWNVQALNRDGKPIGSNNGTSEAFTITVQPVNDAPAAIKLVSPENGETVRSQHPTFSWTLTPGDVNGDGYYKIKIVEIKGDESPEQAFKGNKPFFEKDSLHYFKGNKPHFEKDSLKPLSFQYPSSSTKLEAGKRYAWKIELKGERGVKITESEINEFIVSSNNTSTARLSLISPANSETVRVQNPTFSWNSYLTPADYDGDGYYKIKIVEIKGDESPDNAFRTNKPFFEKDSIARFKGNKPFFERDSLIRLDIQYTSSALKLEPGKRYAWNVQALNRDGKPVGLNNGTSEVWKFMMSTPGNCAINIDSITYSCKGYNSNGKPVYSFKIYAKNNSTTGVTNLGNTFTTDPNNGNAIPPSQNGNYLNIFPSAGGVISNLSPATTVLTVITPGAQQVISGDYTLNNPANKCINFKVFANTFITSGTSVTGNTCSSLKDTCLIACLCKDCDNMTADFSNFNTTTPAGSNGNQFNLSGSINVNVPVYGIEIDVQSYNVSSKPTTCSKGITGIEQSGMILMPGTTINNTSVIQLFNETISGSSASNNNATKQVKLISTTPITGSIPLNLLIGLPGPIAGLEPGCCKMEYQVCLRIKIFYDEKSCKSCVFTKCFQFSN